MHDAVERFADQMVDYIPETMKRDAMLVDLQTAIRQIHFPDRSWRRRRHASGWRLTSSS